MPEKGLLGAGAFDTGDDPGQDGSENGRKRVVRSLGMSEEEVASRERRKERFKVHMEDGRKQLIGPRIVDKKPWHTLAIGGSLGENLSHIERKDREIEQQRYIVQHHLEHSPQQLERNIGILNRLMLERGRMEDNEENNMPQNEREKPERVRRRLEVLRWALGTSHFEGEKVNILAAIYGYESGKIPYSHNFTLIYAGNIVDTCPTYRSFCADREERLDRYYIEYGPGWLWQEPPLDGPEPDDGLAKRGVCLERDYLGDKHGIGAHPVTLEFEVYRSKVSRQPSRPPPTPGHRRGQASPGGVNASCQFNTLLDSGATFPILLQSDLARLDIDMVSYGAQGVMDLQVVGGQTKMRFYEMFVSVCSKDGEPIVGPGNDAVWPSEPRVLGGFFPVLAMDDPPNGKSTYFHRLSGMVPFDACYMSSGPGTGKIWIGEDRRDVLGAGRLPAHLRFDSNRVLVMDCPSEFVRLRREARTPERVIFLHEFPKRPGILLTDSDTLGSRGQSELAIGHYETGKDNAGRQTCPKVIPQRVVRLEPRKGNVRFLSKYKPRRWQKDFK